VKVDREKQKICVDDLLEVRIYVFVLTMEGSN